MTEDQVPEGSGMELVMPFVSVSSVGGPYDDDAFAAGWQCGLIAANLEVAERLNVTELTWPFFRTALAKQVDLIAMRHGFVATIGASEEYPEWGVLIVTRGDADAVAE